MWAQTVGRDSYTPARRPETHVASDGVKGRGELLWQLSRARDGGVGFCSVPGWPGVVRAVDGGRNCPAKEMNGIFEAWKPAEKKWRDSARTVCEVGHSPRLQGKDKQKVPAAEKGRRTFQTVVSSGHSGLPSALCLAQAPGSLQTLRRVGSPFLPQRWHLGTTTASGHQAVGGNADWKGTGGQPTQVGSRGWPPRTPPRQADGRNRTRASPAWSINSHRLLFFPTSCSNVDQGFVELKRLRSPSPMTPSPNSRGQLPRMLPNASRREPHGRCVHGWGSASLGLLLKSGPAAREGGRGARALRGPLQPCLLRGAPGLHQHFQPFCPSTGCRGRRSRRPPLPRPAPRSSCPRRPQPRPSLPPAELLFRTRVGQPPSRTGTARPTRSVL